MADRKRHLNPRGLYAMSLEEVAEALGITRARALRIEKVALLKIARIPGAVESLRGLAEIAQARRGRARTWADDEEDI